MPVISVCMPSDTDFLVSFRMPLRGVIEGSYPVRLSCSRMICMRLESEVRNWIVLAPRMDV